MKKCASAFTALFLAASLLFLGGCSPQPPANLPKSADSQLTVDVNITDKTEDGVSIKTAVPQFGGFDVAGQLNSKIQDIIDDGIAEVEQAKKDLDKNPERPPVPLLYQSFFDYSSNEDVLSTYLTSYNYTGGAHGMTYLSPFTVNRKTGECYSTLGSLFTEPEAGKKQITEKILAQIKAKPDEYFPEAEKTVQDKNGDFHFYIEGDNLVVYFDLYDIAPYAAGIQYFKFPLKDLNVKPEFKGMNQPGAVRKNGATLEFKNKVISDDNGTFLPLEETAQALSHTVEEKNGTYTVDGKAVQPTMFNNVAYMSLGYFTETLGDFVIYYDDILRLFMQTAPKQEEPVSSGSVSSAAK
jgi:hypothetical protein